MIQAQVFEFFFSHYKQSLQIVCYSRPRPTFCMPCWIFTIKSLILRYIQCDIRQYLQHYYTEWFKKMDSISYVYISWTMHGIRMIYITFERGGPRFSNTTARAFAYRTAVKKRQLRAKWLICSTNFRLYTDSLFAQIGDSNDKCSSSLKVECWNEDETHAVQQSPTQF